VSCGQELDRVRALVREQQERIRKLEDWIIDLKGYDPFRSTTGAEKSE
jgi:hypothetical protein